MSEPHDEAAVDPAEVAELFGAALDLPAGEREAFLAGACAGRRRLRDEVAGLLAVQGEAAGFLERPAVALLAEEAARGDAEAKRIGPYRVLSELGRGGMGTVYLAERADGAFEQRVALKVIRGGFVSTATRERFFRERQILARLEQPNIARLLDGGIAEDGSPWFAMELVLGTPLVAFCDARRLPIAARLGLFEQACRAVQHAHANLVVHRDLKPSNMLVAEDGSLKLLDFGIAKVLSEDADESTMLTRGGIQPLTPAYAAPEQLRGEAATTATDVYALGVVLYELLTGKRPFPPAASADPSGIRPEPESMSSAVTRPRRGRGPAGAMHELAPEDVAAARGSTPGRLRRALAGDLEAIVLQALHPEARGRYPSVEALAEDLRRFRSGLPVRARPATWRYRAGKLVRRHRVGMAAAAAAVMSLLAGLLASLWQAQLAARERDRAEEAAAESQEVATYLVDLFRNADPEHREGGAVTARELLDRGAARLDVTLRDRPLTRARLQQAIASVYHSMRVLDQERKLLEAAVAVREKEQGGDHPDLMAPLLALGFNHFQATRYAQAHAALQRVTRIAVLHDREGAAELPRALLLLGNLQLMEHSWGEAEATFRRTLAVLDKRVVAEGLDRPRVLNNLGVALSSQGRLDEAARVHREALATRERSFGPRHFTVAQSLFNLARVELDRGEAAAARPLLERSLAIREATYGRRHNVVAESLALRAEIALAEDRPEAAEADWREAVRIDEGSLGVQHPETAALRLRLALLLAEREREDEAAPLAEAALAVLASAEGADPVDALRARATVAELRLRGGDARGAIQAMGLDGAGPATAGDVRTAIEAFANRLEKAGLAEEAARLRAAGRAGGGH